MLLVELRANNESFNTVRFNPTGISIIAAIKETDDQKKTYNSVGKSLTIALVHFCLGSAANSEFKEKLVGWEFTLEFKVKDKTYTATRSTNKQSQVFLNGKKYKLDDFKNEVEKLVFRVPENAKYISFRGLISRFIRPGKSSYVNYSEFIKNEDKNPVTPLANTAFLLGLDINLVLKKYELKEQQDNIDAIADQLKNPEFKSLFEASDDSDVEIKIVDLENKIKKIKANLKDFKVAEDFYSIKKDADEISRSLISLKNEAGKFRIAISNIQKSLEIKPDITKERIIRLYNQAKVQLGANVVKQLEDVQAFNHQLLGDRTSKLIFERTGFENGLKIIERDIAQQSKAQDEKLRYLDTHGALDEFSQINQQLTDYEKRLERLNQYKNLVNEYKLKRQENKKKFADENIKTDRYLVEAENVVKSNISLFKSFTEEFYGDKSSGISVENNEGNNTIRFNIRAKIQDDSGDGVNEAKIFCFDWTLLKGQHNHSVKFIFHDSRIADGMDTRQIKTLLEIADKECKESGLQYIISLNENLIENLKAQMNEEEFQKLVINNIILRLSDKSEKEKLLGIQVDLDYEK